MNSEFARKWVCLNCLEEHEMEPIYENEEYTIKGKKVVITALKAKCPCCGEYMENDNAAACNLEAAYNTYRREEKLLYPDDIKKIRQKYGVTQVGFSRILGFGDKTIARYENGSLQDVAPNNLILLVKNTDNFIKLWKIRKSKLDPKDNASIEKALGYKTAEIKIAAGSNRQLTIVHFPNFESAYKQSSGGACRA